MKKVSLILLAIASISLAGCNSGGKKDNPPAQDVSDVTIALNMTTIVMLENETQQLQVTLSRPVSYSFSSSDDSIASIDANGVITAHKKGDCIVRAYLNDDSSIKALCSITVMSENDYTTVTINDVDIETNYRTNFFTETLKGLKLSFYRVAGYGRTPSDSMVMIYPNGNFVSGQDDNPYLPGSMYNDTAIFGLKHLSITYRGEGQVRYGMDRQLSELTPIPNHTSMEEYSINFPANFSYFSIEALTNLCIKSITLKILGTGQQAHTDYAYEGKRITPNRSLNPLEGQTASMPIKTTYQSDGTYHVDEWKTYTYHSSSYVIDHHLDAASNSYVEPMDIANYYYLFNSVPPNFGMNKYFDSDASYATVLSSSKIYSYYGEELTRLANTYSRIDGYANSIPYNKHDSSPLYIEFDVALSEDYSINSRDVGRLVTWVDGFSCYSDKGPVSTFTGDHYYTFWEYDNMGGWNHPFDATIEDTYRTSFIHCPATTYSYS